MDVIVKKGDTQFYAEMHILSKFNPSILDETSHILKRIEVIGGLGGLVLFFPGVCTVESKANNKIV